MTQERIQDDFFGDAALMLEKSTHVLQWVRRRVKERLIGETPLTNADENGSFELLGDSETLIEVLYQKPQPLACTPSATTPGVDALLDSLRVEVFAGGATNFSLRVWAVDWEEEETQCGQRSSVPTRSGVFVKVALPYARWAGPNKKCDVSRLDREFRGLGRLSSICPGVTSHAIMCGSDDVIDDGTKYLINEFLSGQYEQYIEQFQRGTVDVRPAQALGYTLAKFHVLSPSRFNGKEGILDVDALHFLSKGHYKSLSEDMKSYMDPSVKSPHNERRAFEPAPEIRRKHSEFLRSNPELFRAVSRHWDNFLNPPVETATFAHLDSHVLNILVRTDNKERFEGGADAYPYSFGDAEYDPGEEGLMKLIDMEFSNWGPSGADLGLFIGSAFLYGLMHSCSAKVTESQTLVSTIPAVWKAYVETYMKYARKEGRGDNSIVQSLYKIVHEALGWAGVWIFRFTSPSLFLPICISKFLYTIPKDLAEELANRKTSDGVEDGLELLRNSSNKLAAKALVMGFGDEAHDRTSRHAPGHMTIDDCNEKMESFVSELVRDRKELRSLMDRTIVVRKVTPQEQDT